jgi:hypothetical protein
MPNAENTFSLPRETQSFTRHGLWETVRINQSTHTSASNPPTVSIAPPPGLQWCSDDPADAREGCSLFHHEAVFTCVSRRCDKSQRLWTPFLFAHATF